MVSFSVSLNKFKKHFVSFVLASAVFCFSGAGAFCLDNYSSKLNEIEKNYYGYTFAGTAESRLTRLENAIYGSASKKPQKTRIEKIYKDLNLGVNTGGAAPAAANAQQQSAAPFENGIADTGAGMSSDISPDIGPKAEAGIKYPVVDKLEQKTFKKTYENEDIYVRLARLEKQVFPREKGKSTRSLNERVDALRGKILGGTQNQNGAVEIDPATEEIVLENGQRYYGDDDANANSYFNNSENEDDSHYNYYSYENSKNRIPEVQSKFDDTNADDSLSDGGAYAEQYAQSYDLDILEKSLLGKRYTSEAPQKRLARLESKVFSRTFNDDEEARIQRLLAVSTAQKTSQEYDSNKWARRLNTGIQIGSILLMVLAIIL